MSRNYQSILKYLSHPVMIHVHHIIWVVSWEQIANFVLICEQAVLVMQMMQMQKMVSITLKSLTVY